MYNENLLQLELELQLEYELELQIQIDNDIGKARQIFHLGLDSSLSDLLNSDKSVDSEELDFYDSEEYDSSGSEEYFLEFYKLDSYDNLIDKFEEEFRPSFFFLYKKKG